MEGYAYFPAIVYRDERPDFVEKILPTCVQYMDKVRSIDTPMCQSGHMGNDPTLREVSDYILLSSVEMLRSQGYITDRYDFCLKGLWAQEIIRGGGTDVHVHRNSQVSGWLFLETPQGGAYPIYHDTRLNKSMAELDFVTNDEVVNATSTIHFNNMKPGTLLFGNSWMKHQLSGSRTENPTRCVHFVVSHTERPCNTL